MRKRTPLSGKRARQKKSALNRQVSLHIEQLEQRMLMDGAGFVNTDPPEDPDTIVGVAGIVASDDHRETRRGTIQLRIDPLRNDTLPAGSENLRIKSVSATKLGNTVTISEDGQRLIYNAGEGGLQASDTFYYIVESDDGKLGKANVNLSLKRERGGGGGGSGGSTPRPRTSNDKFAFFEDSSRQRLDVLRNDREFRQGEIIAVSLVHSSYSGPLEEAPPSGSIYIAAGGKALVYRPSKGFSGSESFSYTVRDEDGKEATASVSITINKPISVLNYQQNTIQLDFGTTEDVSRIAFRINGQTPEKPYIESIDTVDYAGEFSVTPNGKRLVYRPDPHYIGNFSVSYTVRYGSEDYQVITGTLRYLVQNSFLVVDNWFTVEPNSNESQLEVLNNDPIWSIWKQKSGRSESVSLKVASVSTGDQGGQLRVAEDGKSVFYQPAAGFVGDETFTYEVLASNGVRDSATVTVHVAEAIADPSGVNRFADEGELQQFLIDKAVAQYARQFGVSQQRYAPPPESAYNNPYISYAFAADDTNSIRTQTAGIISDYSETNTQVAGVDEADIVETDGHYVYTFTNGTLVIVDVSDPTTPRLVSFTEFEGKFDLMYLQGERMTLLKNGSQRQGGAEILVLDISDRSAPTTLERTEIDGYIADSRAIGDRVHLVVKRAFLVPELGGEWLVEPIPPAESTALQSNSKGLVGGSTNSMVVDSWYPRVDRGEPGVWRNETLDEYVSRVRDSLIDTGLPSFYSYNAAGELVGSGLLTNATRVHKPVAGSDLLVSLLTIDAGDEEVGPMTAATSFVADSNTEVFVSAESAYVFALDPQAGQSTVYKLAFEQDGSTPIVASGIVGGRLLNQFSADEYDGYLRVATTEVRNVTIKTSWGRTRVQQQRFNNVVVMEQQGNKLTMVGEVTNLAPTETIQSVRFMGDRAYVVTFRVVDPLFALDMSDPTNPTVEGALKIPGFSNYLQPVGSNYLIGIGRDANEITGRLGPLQITLFNVSDLSDPYVADQVTFEGAMWVNSEAWIEPQAVSFFAESGVLAIPIAWSEQIKLEGEEAERFGRSRTENRSAIWTFQVDVENPEGASIVVTGSVEHEAASYSRRLPFGGSVISSWWGGTYNPGSPVRRALRVGESLITVSNFYIKINDLNDPSIQLGEVYLGKLTKNDSFTIDEDSGPQVLDVSANDLSDPGEESPQLFGVTQPTTGGAVTLSADGETLIFTPEQDFFGQVRFTYTTLDEIRGEETATVNVMVENVVDDITAVDDTFLVEVDSGSTVLDVLENDLNPDFQNYVFPIIQIQVFSAAQTYFATPLVLARTYTRGLSISEVGKTDQTGSIELNELGELVYTPAEGFEGIETFEYTITDRQGRTDVGTVTVLVGVNAEPIANELVFGTLITPDLNRMRRSDSQELINQDRIERTLSRRELPTSFVARRPHQETDLIDLAFSSVGSAIAHEVPFVLDNVLFDELVRDQLSE